MRSSAAWAIGAGKPGGEMICAQVEQAPKASAMPVDRGVRRAEDRADPAK
jgi:hypothetical protein